MPVGEGLLQWMTPAPLLEVRVLPNRDQVVVEAKGELCLATSEQLRAQLEAVGEGFARVILDLSRVTFIDSTGIHLLLQADARAKELNFQFALVVPDGQPSRALAIVGLDTRPNRISQAEVDEITDGEGSPLRNDPTRPG